MKFNIGGSVVAQVVDIILPMFSRLITTIMNQQVRLVVKESIPSAFNQFAKQQKGFFNFGSMLDNPIWDNSIFDYSLDHLGFS